MWWRTVAYASATGGRRYKRSTATVCRSVPVLVQSRLCRGRPPKIHLFYPWRSAEIRVQLRRLAPGVCEDYKPLPGMHLRSKSAERRPHGRANPFAASCTPAMPMASVPRSLLSDILGQVKLNYPELARGWFTDLSLAKVDGGVLEIRAVNGAQARYLREHCRLAFAEAAQAATGRLVSVAFEAEKPEDDYQTSVGLPFESANEELVLNSDCTFENFITGPCNRLAHAAAVAIAEEPGHAYNPFFVHGRVGLGKTHLLQAICHTIRTRHPRLKTHYISSETFINHFIGAVERGALHEFRYRYRYVDVLVIDDIQFLAERERSQEEFFHTFNTLQQSQRQIVLSADCSPPEIPSLEERLVSRFNSGLVALVDRPCLDTRMAIVRNKAKLRCIEVSEAVVRLVASRVATNIRELEGALIKIDAMSQAEPGEITLDLARKALGAQPDRPVAIPAILERVATRFGVRVSELQGKRRSKTLTFPRHVCMYLARRLTSQSLEEIGGYFGGRDHTTVLHACRAVARQAQTAPELAAQLEEISREIRDATI